MHRRKFLLASASAVALTTMGSSCLSREGLSWAAHVWDLACRYPDIRCIYPNHMLTEAWELTDGKDPAAMYQALTERFGPFPIWFIDHRSEVVIRGVLDLQLPDLQRKGYFCCDLRGRKIGLDGWQITPLDLDDPLPKTMHYYEPSVDDGQLSHI